MPRDRIAISVDPKATGLIGEALEAYFAETLGPRIQGNARRTVPVRTGDLKKSIVVQVTRDGDDSTLQVGVDEAVAGVDYAAHVELGTSKQAAQPYLRPALLQATGQKA